MPTNRVTMGAPAKHSLTGIVLAGGEGRRMSGQDKGFVEWRGQPLIEHALGYLSPHVTEVMISCHRNTARYAATGHRAIADRWDDFRGPLAGLASVAPAVGTSYLLVCPCDTPLLPYDLPVRLASHLGHHQIIVPGDGQRLHPLCALMQSDLLSTLDEFLNSGGRRVLDWMNRFDITVLDCSADADAFINMNRDSDLEQT